MLARSCVTEMTSYGGVDRVDRTYQQPLVLPADCLIVYIQSLNQSIVIIKMPRPTSRTEVLSRLRKTIADGSIIVGAGAGPPIYTIPLN